MTIATLTDVLQPALRQGYAVPGFVCLGWEDMRAYVEAAEAERAPVILQAGPNCRKFTPLPIIGKMFRHLAEHAAVPVVAHLDHGASIDECREALECGFTSVMFDGSLLALDENIERTAAVAELAHAADASCEGEIGFVGYALGAASAGTDPDEAAKFARETGVDAMAISIGNVHLQAEPGAGLNITLLREIEALTDVALVIHGGSGVPADQRAMLASKSRIAKFNIGTELRMAFGAGLRHALNADPNRFDRIEIMQAAHKPVFELARGIFRNLGASGRFDF
jgi:fructose-bisphosphate aldolase, class II